MADVFVGQAVVDDAPDLAPLHDTPIAQQAQLMREGGFAPADQGGKITHAELVGERERVENSRPGRIGQQLEDRGQLLGVGARDDLSQERLHVLGVQALHVAAVGSQLHICTIVQILCDA